MSNHETPSGEPTPRVGPSVELGPLALPRAAARLRRVLGLSTAAIALVGAAGLYLDLPLATGAATLGALGLAWLLYAPATRLMAATEEHRTSDAHLRKLAEHVPGVVYQFKARADGTFCFPYASEGIRRIYGVTPEQVRDDGTAMFSVVHPDDLARVTAGIAASAQSLEVWRDEFRVLHPERGERWVSGNSTPLRDDDGATLWHGVNVDITEAKEAERREREAKASLEEAQAMVGLGNWTFDVASGRVEWSRQCFVLLGEDPALPPPRYPASLRHYADDDARKLQAAVERAVETGDGYDLLLRLRHPQNDVRVVRAEGKTTRDASGATVRLFGTVMDVTAAVEREEALVRAQAQAEAANLAKSEFLANMSHELHTPMTAILGYADLLADPAAPRAEHAEYTATIRRSAAHLLQIINDLLDVSKIDAGHMRVERVACSPSAIARGVVSLLRPRAQDKGLALSLRFDGPQPRTVLSDPTRLRQILMNLVGNALKFTEAGSVTVAVALDRAAPEPRLLFEVKDSGIGMTEAEQALLFRPFGQADTSATRRFGGTGLGLSIAGRLAAMLGGGIAVSSVPRLGSLFTASVATGSLDGVALDEGLREAEDAAPASEPAPAEHAPKQLEGLRVLLAEDGPDNQRLIALHLRRAGAAVEVVENGQLAVDRLTREGAAPVDAVLMDMQMPVLDGYAATARLRGLGYAGPIIAVTAHAMEGDRQKCLRAGCDDYATKPIDRDALAGAILGRVRPSAATAPPPRAATAPPTALFSEFQGDADMGELIAYFVATMPERIAALESALGASDLAQLTRLVHQLKGAGGGYGFPTITAAAQRVESGAHAGVGVEALRGGVGELVAVCRAARAA